MSGVETMTRPSHQTGRVRSGDVEIFYRRFGSRGATPILIVHGLSYFSDDWIDVAAALAGDREVVAIDMRGFGQSDWSASHDYGLRTLAADIVAVLDGLGWEKAILVGHSMGGRVCLLTTDWYPERVEALACLDFAPDLAPVGRKRVANSIGGQPDVFATVDAALAYHGTDPDLPADALMRLRFEAFLKPVEGGFQLRRDLHYRDKFRAVLETGKREPEKADPWAALTGLDLPVLVVRGSESDLFAAETMDKVRAANTRAEVVEIRGSHDLAADNPDGVVGAIETFLTKADAG